jgi:hypothetical protein
MAEVVKPRLDAEPEPEQKRFARPTRSPELLADLVSGLTHQQKAEMTYELVLFAALAAEDTGHADLNEFLGDANCRTPRGSRFPSAFRQQRRPHERPRPFV